MRSFFLGLISILILESCHNNFVYGEDIDIDSAGWNKDSILVFRCDSIIEMPELIKIGINIRNNIDYYYSNMYLFIEIQIPGNEDPIKDTVNHFLMTPDGYWSKGVEGGNIKESIVYYPYVIKNPPKGIYTIKIQQGMRDDILKGVVSIGSRIEKVEL
tara:strand:- start:60 stop:533 length:474 start_codon:yes stop_codon:yes gene_type:complete